MEFEYACNQIRDDIAQLLVELGRPSPHAMFAAARATGDLAAALHHAAGMPDDARWNEAFASLENFLEFCAASPRAARSAAMFGLRAFLEENAPRKLPAPVAV